MFFSAQQNELLLKYERTPSIEFGGSERHCRRRRRREMSLLLYSSSGVWEEQTAATKQGQIPPPQERECGLEIPSYVKDQFVISNQRSQQQQQQQPVIWKMGERLLLLICFCKKVRWKPFRSWRMNKKVIRSKTKTNSLNDHKCNDNKWNIHTSEWAAALTAQCNPNHRCEI